MKTGMNEPELYHKSNSLQKKDAVTSLEEYSSKMRWRYGDRLIDIGCGDGSVTTDILKTHIPDTFGELVGCDISDNMIAFANAHYKDARTKFSVLDIEKEMPEEYKQCFDHAFSFHTLHWIRQQEKAFSNILGLLREGGDCLLVFMGHLPIFDVYRIMSLDRRWSPWVRDVEKYISPYHDSQDPEKQITQMMTKIGFKNVDVQCKESHFIFDEVESLKNAVMAVNPFSIPKRLHNDFMEDYMDVLRDLRLMDEANNNFDGPVAVKANYSLLVVYGGK